MEDEQNNSSKINKEQNLYTMLEELNKKYNILEKKQKINEEKIEKNEKTIFNLNKNIMIMKKYIDQIKIKIEKDINELKEKINEQNKKDEPEKINNINLNIEQLNNIKLQFDEKNNIIDKKIDELIKDIKEIKKNQNLKDNATKMNEKKDILLVDNFQILLKEIMSKGDIDHNIKERLKIIIENLINSSYSPKKYLTNFLNGYNNKYIEKSSESNIKKIDKLVEINKKIYDYIDKIEKELKQKNKNKANNMKIIESDNKIELFRKKYNIRKEEYKDEVIQNYLNFFQNDEEKVYQALKKNK